MLTELLLWFKESGLPQLAAVAFSITAFAISLATYRHTRRRDSESMTGSRKANLLADLSKNSEVANEWLLKITNVTDVAANNLIATLDETPVLEHKSIDNHWTHQVEVRHLSPKDTITYRLHLQVEYYENDHGGGAITYDGLGSRDAPKLLKVSWTDESGLPGLYEEPLHFQDRPRRQRKQQTS